MTYKRETPRRPTAWVLVADRARARIFESAWPIGGELTEIASLVHPEGQVHEKDVLTDAPGRFAETGGGPHYGEKHTDFRHRTAIDFANVVAERLEKGRVSNAFGHLVIVAPALYLGVLRNTLSSPLSKLVSHEITKDYTHLPARELLPLLQQEPQLNGST
jgi:protein required for attachment to host cells